MKSDGNTAAIVKSLRSLGVDVVYVSSDTEPGVPDLAWGFKGRMGWFEVKSPNGTADCGCTSTLRSKCGKAPMGTDLCPCKGHAGIGNSMRRTRHAQLAWAESHSHMGVTVVRTLEDALSAIGIRRIQPGDNVATTVAMAFGKIDMGLPLRCNQPKCENVRSVGGLCEWHKLQAAP